VAGDSKVTTDHNEIRHWVEDRGGHPASVTETAGESEVGILRIDFEGFGDEESLVRISWEKFFMDTGKIPDLSTNLIAGAVAGLLASLPMSFSMNLMHRMLPEAEKYPLPPREITLAASERVGLGKLVREDPLKTVATGAGHFAYGSLGGAAYAQLSKQLPFPTVIKGLIFALAYWAVGYLGWIPAAGLLSPATRHPPKRTALTITAHLVYGCLTAILFNALTKNKRMGGN
jgi:hypothetical protein